MNLALAFLDHLGVVASLDAVKAFESLEWTYFGAVLWKFVFGLQYILWVKLLYSAPTASVWKKDTICELFPP